MRLAAAMLAVGITACSPYGGGAAFHCETDAQCAGGPCQPDGTCGGADGGTD